MNQPVTQTPASPLSCRVLRVSRLLFGVCKPRSVAVAFAIVSLLVTCGCGSKSGSKADPTLAHFVAEKRIQARQLAAAQTNPVPSLTWKFFDAAEANDWNTASNRFQTLETMSGRRGGSAQLSGLQALLVRVGRFFGQNWGPHPSGLRSEMWSPILETYATLELERSWDPKWLESYAREIIQAVPAGSIYFGGTDAGRFAVSCFSESHVKGRPFLTLTQNALADSTYLAYLRSMYGGLMTVPTPQDSQQAFQQYLTAAQQRLKEGALKPGERVQVSGGRVQVSGQTAVMEVNALLVMTILEKNPGREAYLEESFAVEALYPHMQPRGPIFRLQAGLWGRLTEESLEANRAYWMTFLKQTLGKQAASITDPTAACRFIKNVYGNGKPAGFDGDPGFLKAAEARKAFAEMRSAQARWFAWSSQNATDEAEQQRMSREAELAFTQALLLWPIDGLHPSRVAEQSIDFLRTMENKNAAELVSKVCEELAADSPNE